ncbi:MAG: glycosyltransferase family 2 protein [Chloroflexi bacterium]|nr:glycosyltransferase family 2 protein [Chloroflexota bacterium]
MVDGSKDGKGSVRVILHGHNKGKDAAVGTGTAATLGDVLLIQDADLEYDPRDYPTLFKPIDEGIADVVYGLRFLGGAHRVAMFWHMMANYLLTFMTNILYNIILTCMETGYKVFHREILKRKFRIYEVPITFTPRDYPEGGKNKISRCLGSCLGFDQIEVRKTGIIPYKTPKEGRIRNFLYNIAKIIVWDY